MNENLKKDVAGDVPVVNEDGGSSSPFSTGQGMYS